MTEHAEPQTTSLWPTWQERHPRVWRAMRLCAVFGLCAGGTMLVLDGSVGGFSGPIAALVHPGVLFVGVTTLIVAWLAARLPFRRASRRAVVLRAATLGAFLGATGFILLSLSVQGRNYGWASTGLMLVMLGLDLVIEELES